MIPDVPFASAVTNHEPEMRYVRTYTGRKFYPHSPETLDVSIEDIACHLAFINRYNGALGKAYSVAQHSLLVEELFSQEYPDATPEEKLAALLHDSEEAYLQDMTSPLKATQPEFRALSKKVKKRIFEVMDLPLPDPRVKAIDTNLLVDEMWQLAPWGHSEVDGPHYGLNIIIIHPTFVRSNFLLRFYELMERRRTQPIINVLKRMSAAAVGRISIADADEFEQSREAPFERVPPADEPVIGIHKTSFPFISPEYVHIVLPDELVKECSNCHNYVTDICDVCIGCCNDSNNAYSHWQPKSE